MSWQLIDHRLNEAGVKQEEYEDVLNLFNFFFLLCPKLCLSQPSASMSPYETDYFVPCLLESESDGPFSAASSVATNPMSLIVVSRNVEFFPEQLHFKLMTCCIEEFPDRPRLRRNCSIYHVTDGVDLELIYHAYKYIIITIDTQRPLHEIASLCIKIRLFIIEKLYEVKTPGMPQFQFSLTIQHPGPAIPVNVSKLVCIDEYEHEPLRRDKRNVHLNADEKAALDCWFCDHKDNAARQTQQLTVKAKCKCAEDVVVAVAEKVSHCWKRLALNLAPKLFKNKTKVIEQENKDNFMQAFEALNMWTDACCDTANQEAMIKAMCDIGCRSQAIDVFERELVEHVCPSPR